MRENQTVAFQINMDFFLYGHRDIITVKITYGCGVLFFVVLYRQDKLGLKGQTKTKLRTHIGPTPNP